MGSIDENLCYRRREYLCREMLDWDAPTGNLLHLLSYGRMAGKRAVQSYLIAKILHS